MHPNIPIFQKLSTFLMLLLTAAADTVIVNVTGASVPPGIPIESNFASFSQEIDDATQFLGRYPAPSNAAFVQLMQNLLVISGGSDGPQLRVGGNSAEHSLWWPNGTIPLPPNQTYAITPSDLLSYRQAVRLWNGSLVLDTSMFVIDNASWAVAHVSAVDTYLGWDLVAGVEVGNEVEVFHDAGIRPPSWSYDDYIGEFEAHVAAMHAVGLPRGLIQGAVYCCNNSEYNAGLVNYTSTYAANSVLASISYHRYAVGGCGGKPVYLWELLSDNAVNDVAAYVAPYAAAARSAGVAFRIGEGNSVSCGGREGVSDVFGTALWALDAMLASASVGVTTFNFHGGPQATYSPITVSDSNATLLIVRPLYYAMLAMTFASANVSTVIAVDSESSNPFIKTWALNDANGMWRVVVIHKDPNATSPATVTVRPPISCSTVASLVRMQAGPGSGGVKEKFNITFRGQTFQGSLDGFPIGSQESEPIVADNGGWTFSVDAASAVILSWLQ